MLWVGTSFKMNKTVAEVETYCRQLLAENLPNNIQIFIAPPFTALYAAGKQLEDSNILLAAQNMHGQDAGAFTGEISAAMLKDCGCGAVVLGHSERRRDYNETDETVAQKVTQALKYDLRPIVCMGELQQSGPEEALPFIKKQAESIVRAAAGHDPSRIVFSYVPVWSVGEKGAAASSSHAVTVIRQLKEYLQNTHRFAPTVLYGGSVTLDNCTDYLHSSRTDGVFVGRAGLDPLNFISIVKKVQSFRLG
ncbi:MAG: triose-phosphate isomerase [Pseudomonadota bacterium]|nr:triose-phosphate isomerase [Pseudomonadota bacterium]